MRRDGRWIGLSGLLLVAGAVSSQRWNAHIGGVRELAAVAGGVLFVSMAIVLPFSVALAALRLARRLLADQSARASK